MPGVFRRRVCQLLIPRIQTVVDDDPQARTEADQAVDDFSLVEVVGDDIHGRVRRRDRLVEHLENREPGAEPHPRQRALLLRVGGRREGERVIRRSGQDAVGVGEIAHEGLGRDEPAGERHVELPRVGLAAEHDRHRLRVAVAQRVVVAHVPGGHPVRALARRRSTSSGSAPSETVGTASACCRGGGGDRPRSGT